MDNCHRKPFNWRNLAAGGRSFGVSAIAVVVLAGSLAIAAVPAPAAAAPRVEVTEVGCADPTSDPFAGGSGTETDPYLIATAAQLRALSLTPTYDTCWFRQTASFSLVEYPRWIPIGANFPNFRGVYDGGGHSITGLRVTGMASGGLFSQLKSSGLAHTTAVRNLFVSGTVTVNGFAGGLVSNIDGAVEISNVHVDVDVTSTGSAAGGLAAGISTTRFIERSSALGDTLGYNDVGGFAGVVYAGTIRDSFSRGSVNATFTSGGFAGTVYSTSAVTIEDSYSTGAVLSGSANGFAGAGTKALTTTYWDTTTSGRTTSKTTAVGKTTSELQTLSTYGADWSIASTWSTSNTWVLCSGVNGGYPALTGRYTSDPCTSAAVTVTAPSLSLTSDRDVAPTGYLSSPTLLPGDWGTAPTCGIYDSTNTLVTGTPSAGTYTSRCSAAVYGLASSVEYVDGAVTVTSPAGGRMLLLGAGVESASDIYSAAPDGSGQRLLRASGVTFSEPKWSPNGGKIAFLDKVGFINRVFVMDGDGSNVTQLGAPSGDDQVTEFVWLDDATILAQFPQNGLFTLSLTGSAAVTPGSSNLISSGKTLDQLSVNLTGTAITFVDTVVTRDEGCEFFCYDSYDQYAFTAPITSGEIGTPTRVNDVSNVASHPAFTNDGGSLLYVTGNTTLLKQNLGTGAVTTLVDVGPELIGDVVVDPDSGDAFYQRCVTESCQLPTIQRLPVSGSGTSSLVVSGRSPFLKRTPAAPITTTTTTAVASASIVTGGTITATTTVTASAGTADPTGTVTVYYCYGASTAPTSCSATSGTKVSDITLDAGTAGDGVATATLSTWTPASGIGFYRFFASYAGDTTYPASTETGTAVDVAVDNTTACADPTVDPFAGGKGTQLFPYEIATAAQLRALTWRYLTCRFKQTTDISLAAYSSWQPIGSGLSTITSGFSGVYDGGGFSITGLRVDTGADRTGLFATIVRTSTAAGSISPTVKNLFITGTVSGNSSVGGLVGSVIGGVTISNVHADVDVTGVSSVGGLVGYVQQSSARAATIEYSSSYGSVTGSSSHVGGLVGRFEGGAEATPGVIQYSFARGAVSGTATTGGLVGRFDNTSTYRTNVINSYATGRVRRSSGSLTSFGGLVGGTQNTPSTTSPVFVVTRSFWDTTTTGRTTTASNKGTGYATLAMQTLTTYTEGVPPWSMSATWSPSTTWVLCSGLNGGYPALAIRYASDPCASAPVTLTAQNLTLTSDVVAAAPSFVPTPSLRLPADFATEPTCDIYDASGVKVTGTELVPGTYASRCSGAAVTLATGTIQYGDGVVTVNGATGGRLLLARYYGQRADIVTAALDGSGELLVGTSTTYDPYPVWSPNGQKIAYISRDGSGVAQVYVMNRNGSAVTKVSSLASTAEAETIRWLTDSKIVVNTDATAGNELGVITLGTTNTYAAVTSSGLSIGNSFSINPAGDQITYSGRALSTTYALRRATFSTTSMGTASDITPTGSMADGHSNARHFPIYTADGTALIYVNAVTANGVTNRQKIVSRNLSSGTETVVWSAPGSQGITNLTLEPVSGDLFFNFCEAQAGCSVPELYRVKVEASATATLVSRGVLVGSVAPVVKTPTTSAVRVDVAVVAQGGSASVTATVSAGWENVDPTGDVSFSYCYDASAMPATCAPTASTAIDPVVGLTADASLDGTATATFSFTPPDGPGFYRLAASYAGTTSFSESTTSTTFALDGPPCADPAIDPFAGGTGTPFNPYQIATAAQLAAIDSTYTTCSFVQTADISLAGYRRWTPIGSGSTAGFAGVYDGDGHMIADLRVEGALNGGLFSTLKDQGSAVVVRDLFISGSMSGGGNLGAVAGSSEGSVSISNVHVDVDLTSPGDRIGGLVGVASAGSSISGLSIENSSASGQLSGRLYVGGLVGWGLTMTIADSFARGSVTGSGSVGGIAGFLTAATITRSYSTAPITATGGSGGLVGQGFDLTVTDSFWDLTTSGTATTDGGGTGRVTADMKLAASYTNWNVASSWATALSSGTDWLICSSLNGGYPALVSRFTSNPCTAAAYTVTAPSFTIAADVPVPSISFLSSPLSLPSDWGTAPTCAVYSGSTAVTGKLTAGGTYTTQCSGGVSTLASSVTYTAGTVTVTAVGTGGRLLVALPSGGVADLARTNLDGSNRLLIGSTTRSDPNAEWSPDGTKIAYIDDVNGQPQVFVMDADGTDVVQMTNVTTPTPVTLSWITDSAVLVDTNAKAWILTGQDQYAELAGSPSSTQDITVSPDGTKVAFVAATSTTSTCVFTPCTPTTTTTYSLRTAPLTLSSGSYTMGTPTPIAGATVDTTTVLDWTIDGASLVYTVGGNTLKLARIDASSAPVTVYSEAPKAIRSLDVDPGSGSVFFALCSDSSCTASSIYSAPAQAGATATLAMADATAPSVRIPDPLDTTTVTAVSSPTGVASGTIGATTTVAAVSGATDPTGTVTYYACYSATSAPASCDVATGTRITPDVTITSDGTADGSATATLSSWTPASGVGYYRFHAVYNGSTRFNPSSESGTSLNVAVDDRAQCADPSADPFAGGKGTQLDPYLVATAAQLAAITATYDSCSFLQTADISLAGYRNWTPIGSWGSPYFQGSYDGGGYSITGLWVAGATSTGGLFAGLSKSTSYRAVVQNLFVTGRVSGTNTLGGLAGTVGSGVTISNVHVDVDVTGTGGTVGGLVGQLSGSGATISGSSAYGDVTGTTSVGGLAGVTNGVTIANSFARGSVTGTDKVGGLLGGITSTTVTNSYATGRVTGTTDVGGLAGDTGAGTDSITGSYWDTTTSQQATSTFGTGATTSEMATMATFSGWSIASSWSSPMTSTWLICDGVNGGYPTLSSRYSSDPCSGTVTVTGASLSMTADIRVPTMSFVSSPVILPSEWSTAPTCTVYDGSNDTVSGTVAVGSYDVRCAGGVLSPSRTINYSSGTLTTTTAGTGGRAVAALIGGDYAYIVTMQPDGTQMRRVRETTTTAPMPQVSPEGDRIAFIDTASDGTLEVFTMKIDGSNVVQMSSSTAVPETLAWAGNGIILIDIQGGGLLRVSISNPLSTATVTVPTASSIPVSFDTITVNYDNSGVLYSRTESTNYTSYDAPLTSSGISTGGRLPSGSETNIKYPTYHPARNGSLFVKNDNTIVWRNSSSTSVDVIQEAGKMIRWIDTDPVNSTVYFELCDTNPCGSTVGSIYSAPIQAGAAKTLVLANATTPSISFAGDRPAPTLSLSPASSTSYRNGPGVTVTATLTAPSGTTTDPTGSIVFYSCYSTTALPTSCTFADANRTKEGTVTLSAGTANDGVSTASRTVYLNVVGWYLIVAVHDGTATYFGVEQSATIISDDRAQCADPSVDPFGGGKGTQLDPYLISTAAQLAAITRTYGQCSFKQTADISLAAYSDWTPIGSWGAPYFYGAYNGDGYSIVDMTVNVASNGGLFAGLGRPDSRYGGTYQNLYISGTVAGGDNLGGLAGFVSAPSSSITISNVHVDVDVTSTGSNVGGLVGQATRGVINGSSAIGDVTARTAGTSNTGGLAGYVNNTPINDSFARGAVAGVANVGGLIGSAQFTFVNRSYSTGAVTSISSVGGLVGAALFATPTASYWDSATSGTTTSASGTALTTGEMAVSTNYSGWSIATAWSSPVSTTWLLCSGVNNGYPVQSTRYSADPCSTSTFTVNAASVSTTVDRGATQAITFTTSPATLPSEWTTLPTCAVYDSSDVVRTGALPAGTYSVRCSGGTLARASSLSHTPGTLTVASAGAGGRVVVSLSSGNRAYVATMAPDGTALRRVRATTTGTPRPVVSPNGEKIAFIDKATDGSLQVFTMDLEGTNVVQMTNGTQVPEGVAWVDNSVLLIDQVGGKLLRLAARNDPKELPSSTTTMDFVSVDAAGTSIVYRDTVSGTNYVYRATLTSTDISAQTQLVNLGSFFTGFSAIFSADDLSVLYVANNGQIKSRLLATGTETTILSESDLNFNDGFTARAILGSLSLDRVTGKVFYNVCLQAVGCLMPLTKNTNLTGTISTALIAENLATASASTTPRVATTVSTTVDDATLLSGDTIGGTTTVTAASGTTDPSGTVTFYYCYSDRTAPTSCSSTTGTAITPDIPLTDDATDDGVATATVTGWTPAEGVGFYRFHAEYSGDTAFRPASESGTALDVAVDDRAVCADPAADPFAGGSGTFLDPYQIATAGQLAAISATYELCVFRQTADISLARTSGGRRSAAGARSAVSMTVMVMRSQASVWRVSSRVVCSSRSGARVLRRVPPSRTFSSRGRCRVRSTWADWSAGANRVRCPSRTCMSTSISQGRATTSAV